MKLSADSKIGDILGNKEAVKMMEEYSPGITKSAKIKLVKNMTIRELASIPLTGITEEQVKEFDVALRSIKC